MPLFACFCPTHPRHLAGEIQIRGLRLLEDALFHQLGAEGLGRLQRGRVGFGLGEALLHELAEGELSRCSVGSLTLLVTGDLPASPAPTHTWNPTLVPELFLRKRVGFADVAGASGVEAP